MSGTALNDSADTSHTDTHNHAHVHKTHKTHKTHTHTHTKAVAALTAWLMEKGAGVRMSRSVDRLEVLNWIVWVQRGVVEVGDHNVVHNALSNTRKHSRLSQFKTGITIASQD